MLQVFIIFYLPIFVGLLFRFLLGKRKKGYLLSVVSALAACGAWIVVFINMNGGLEYYGLQAVLVSHFAGGSILAEVYFVLRVLFGRYMKEKGKASRIAALLTALVWIVVALFLVYRANNQGTVSPDLTLDYGTDTSYTQTEIDAAAKEVEKYFKKHHEDYTLTNLRYSGDRSALARQDYHAAQGLAFSGFCTYDIDVNVVEEWGWLLVREDGGSWRVVDMSRNYKFE